MRIAISGAGIAGTTLAGRLLAAGHEPVLIEAAPALRTGGYLVDFWGLGFTVAERMGLRDRVLAEGYRQREVRFVDDRSRRAGGFPVDVLGALTGGRFTTIRRGALVRLLFDALDGRVETIFGDRIVAVDAQDDGVAVTLERGGRRAFDLVIGADGLHSAVRSLCFGPEAEFEAYLGYAVAAFEVAGYRPRDEGVYVIHPTPGHQLARCALRDDRTLFLMVFRCDAETARDPAGIRALLRAEFGGTGWEAPAVLEALDGADNLYFDRMSQIRMPAWHRGRVALLGDAAAAVSLLAGEGTGLAMIEAYVLAGELGRAGSDHGRAFREYERRLRPFLADKQKSAERFAAGFVPRTALGVWARNQVTRLMRLPGVGRLLLGRTIRDDLDLPDYGVYGGP